MAVHSSSECECAYDNPNTDLCQSFVTAHSPPNRRNPETDLSLHHTQLL
jgi:hypothetical protein